VAGKGHKNKHLFAHSIHASQAFCCGGVFAFLTTRNSVPGRAGVGFGQGALQDLRDQRP
jgi:hypothetical protein